MITSNTSPCRGASAIVLFYHYFRAIHDAFSLLFTKSAQFRLIIPGAILRAIYDTFFLLFTKRAQLRQIILGSIQPRWANFTVDTAVLDKCHGMEFDPIHSRQCWDRMPGTRWKHDLNSNAKHLGFFVLAKKDTTIQPQFVQGSPFHIVAAYTLITTGEFTLILEAFYINNCKWI